MAGNRQDLPFEPNFLDGLDADLEEFCSKLDSAVGSNLTKLRIEARQLCNDVTHSDPPDHRLGVEKNRLLLPGWENTWQQSKEVHTLQFVLGLNRLLSDEQVDYLYKAVRQLVRFVVDGTTDHIRHRIADDLRGALGDYLSLRGHSVAYRGPAVKPRNSAALKEAAELEQLNQEIPLLDEASENWISNKAAAKLLGSDTETVANHRYSGQKNACGDDAYGLHDQGCFWRKQGNKHPRYYLPLMKQRAGHLVKIFPKARLDLLDNRH